MIKTYKNEYIDYAVNLPDVLKTDEERNTYIKTKIIGIYNSMCMTEILKIKPDEDQCKTLALEALIENKAIPQEWTAWKTQRDAIILKYQSLKDLIPNSF